MLERELPPPLVCFALTQNLGQDLFAPPNVKGWDGGLSWITTNNLLARYNYAEMLVFGTAQLNLGGGKGANKGLKFIASRFNRMNSKGTPLDLNKLFTPEERNSKTALVAALEKRLLQSNLKPRQEQALRESLDSRSELD